MALRQSVAVAMLTLGCAVVAISEASHEFVEGGSERAGQGVMLLQVSAQLSSPSLPPVSKMLEGSSKHFEHVNSQVSVLEQQLLEVQQQYAAALDEKKAEYAQELGAQKAESHRIEEQNAKIDANLSALNKENAHLRRQAVALQKECGSLRADLRGLVSNFTTSREFASESLDRLNGSTVDLSVLQEVDAEDAAKAAHEEHSKRFDSIIGQGASAPAAVSFLQVGAQPARAATAVYKQMLSGLEAGFQALAKEQEDSEADLKKRFDEDFRTGAGRQSVLLAAHESLAAAAATSAEQRTRLQEAVRHLQRSKEFLQERIMALRTYAKRVGSGAVAP